MSKSEWKEGIVRPTLRADVYGQFGLYNYGDNRYSVTHLATGFRGHDTDSAAEARALAEAFDAMPGWENVMLAPDGSFTIIGITEEFKKAATETKNKVLAAARESTQHALASDSG